MSTIDKLKGLLGSEQPGTSGVEDLTAKAQDFVNKTWNERKGSLWVYHQRIWESRLFYSGQFYFDFDTYRRMFTPRVPEDDFIPQPKINRFSPAVDSIASNFSSIPEVEATPVPDDDEQSMGICEVINELTKHCIKDNALRSDYKSDEDKAGYAANELVLSGSVFSIVYPEKYQIGVKPVMAPQPAFGYQCTVCDSYQTSPVPVDTCPTCGNPVVSQPTEVVGPQLDEMGQPVTEPVNKTRVVVKIGDPGFCFPRSGARNMGETGAILWAERFTLEDIRKRWNFEAIADNERSDGFSVQYEHALMYWMVGYNASSLQGKDAALVVQCFCEPDELKDFPQGLYAAMINGKVIYATTWEFCEHPLSKCDYLQLPSLFFGRTPSTDMVELQRTKNTLEAIVEAHAKTCAIDPWVIEQNCIVSKITGATKVVLWQAISPGIKEPHRAGHGTLDPAIYTKIDKIDAEFDVVSMASSVFRGEQPGSVTANSAIQTLRGQAEMRFAKPVQNWMNFWKETIRKVIKNYQKCLALEELVEICGDDKVEQIQAFMQADLDKKVEFVATSQGLPRTRDEKRQEMMVLFDKGALDLSEPGVRKKIYELFGETGMMQTFNDDARRARLNINKIKQRKPAAFRPGIDDPDIHLGIALEAAKGLDFDSWPIEIQQQLYLYIQSIQQYQQSLLPPPEEPGKEPPAQGSEAVNG